MRFVLIALACLSCGQGTPQTTGPVVATVPASLATGVTPAGAVKVVFTRQIRASALTAAALQVLKGGNTAVDGTLNADGELLVFAPAADLLVNTQYTARLSPELRFEDGTVLGQAYEWTFTTGSAADHKAPTVLSTTPAADATGASPATVVSATFSETLNPASITQATFTVTGDGGTAVPGLVGSDAATATFTPRSPLTPSVRYTATLSAAVKDTADNEIGTPFSWSFTIGGAASSLIQNGSFESDTASPPAGWVVTTSGAFTAVTTPAHQGTNAAKFATLTSTISGREARSTCFSVAQRAVNLSAWLFTPEAVGNTKASFKVWFFKDASCATAATVASATQASFSLNATNAWELHTYSATPGTDALSAYVSMRASYAAPGTSASVLWFDDLAVTQ